MAHLGGMLYSGVEDSISAYPIPAPLALCRDEEAGGCILVYHWSLFCSHFLSDSLSDVDILSWMLQLFSPRSSGRAG